MRNVGSLFAAVVLTIKKMMNGSSRKLLLLHTKVLSRRKVKELEPFCSKEVVL